MLGESIRICDHPAAVGAELYVDSGDAEPGL